MAENYYDITIIDNCEQTTMHRNAQILQIFPSFNK